MKLRSQLILAFLLVSVLPLAAIVLYSFYSSQAALRRAAAVEGERMAADMQTRLRGARRLVQREVERIGPLATDALLRSGGSAELDEETQLLLRELAEVPEIEGLQVLPVVPRPPHPPAGGDQAETPQVPAPPVPGLVIRLAPDAGKDPADPAQPVWQVIRLGQDVTDLAVREAPELASMAVALRAREESLAKLIGEISRHERSGDAAQSEGSAGQRIQQSLEEARRQSQEQLQELQRSRDRARLLLGGDFELPLRSGDQVIGHIQPQIRAEKLLLGVLQRTRRDRGEIPFAVDAQGQLYASDDDRAQLRDLGLVKDNRLDPATCPAVTERYVLSLERDPETGLTLGIARPTQGSMEELRRNAVTNLGFGLLLVGLALLGILPLSGRLTRSLADLTEGANRLADGDLEVRVPVRSGSELGQLARSFNHMAFQLHENQQRLVAGERHRREQEVHQRLLQAENLRKGRELEEARRFQLSLLPKELPRPAQVSIAVHTATATEVGGDYYDFHLAADGGILTTVIGDATGHGARAGTMVAVIKSLFSARASQASLPAFLTEAAATIKGMRLERMAMALTLARLEHRRLTVSCAGMPPVLLFRAAPATVEEIALPGMPLGGIAGFAYSQWQADLEPGDTVLLMSDGFAERVDPEGDVLGYERARELFAAAAREPADEVIRRLTAAAESWGRGWPLEDDMTFVVLKLRAS